MPLVDELRHIIKDVTAMTWGVKDTCNRAANELERLQEREGELLGALAGERHLRDQLAERLALVTGRTLT